MDRASRILEWITGRWPSNPPKLSASADGYVRCDHNGRQRHCNLYQSDDDLKSEIVRFVERELPENRTA